MAKRKMYKKKSPKNNLKSYGLLFMIIIIIIVIGSITISSSKENLGFRNIIKDDKVRDRYKKECKALGGNWWRGGDLIADLVHGPNTNCVVYRIDADMIGGYCCHNRKMR